MLHLAFPDKLLYRSGHVLDGHVRIDSVLVKQIDGVDLEPLQRSSATCLMCSGRLLRPCCRPFGRFKPELRGDHDPFSNGESASPTSSSLVRSVDLGCVEEGDAAVDRRAKESDHSGLSAGGP